MRIVQLRSLVFLAVLPACSGAVYEGKGDSGVGGAQGATGGSTSIQSTSSGTAGNYNATGGHSASPSVGGATGGTTEPIVCCLAMPTCGSGETQIGMNDTCPTTSTCRTVTMCCTTIVCASAVAQCDGMPACDSGDKEVSGACPSGSACYQRTLCGSTVTCVHVTSTVCDPSSEYNRSYKSKSVTQCQVIDYRCPTNTSMFTNDCGCGCEQAASCPPWVDCMPGPDTPEPLCSASDSCPYTVRAM